MDAGGDESGEGVDVHEGGEDEILHGDAVAVVVAELLLLQRLRQQLGELERR